MVHGQRELRPPAELVEAIQNSEDMTAPTNELSSGGGASGDVPRAIRNRLATGEPRALRRPVDLGAELMGAIPAGEDKKAHEMEVRAMHMDKPMKYDRQHVTAGQAGRGDQRVNSAASKLMDPRQRGSS